jgi:cytochrome c peroxidase
MARLAASQEIDLPRLSEDEVEDILAFLDSLTGAAAATQDFDIPSEVPSKLPLDQ